MNKTQYTLKMLRAKEDITQKEAGERVGVSEATWHNWEKQKSFPNVPQIKAIENNFNVTYDEIIFFDVKHGLTVKLNKE
ncbi:DNA-binding transcriptional regulator, XRE-family HTH domain [Granulicatella balaenopterae]|uniref:DNA-binding transcriptional regulator, XRE-family HTH domain n=1 Tax=Granulicatella balaenopterae TaxID=137733 RepID=A0A1H9IQ90_9LACT|nr:helix-turn-helix transcriptional regulator [Granulicatella balaenopterae]SEQ76687.1 DNA-binding transcriptional regulator, XRE-family HTH domain [Granulicatella balaenopterae]